MAEHAFHGINTSLEEGRKCYPCVRTAMPPMSRVEIRRDAT